MPQDLHDSANVRALSLPAYIDSSTLSTWRSCRRKFFWSTVNSLYPTGKSIHLVAGGAFAAGMEAARRLVFTRAGDYRPKTDDILQAAYLAFIREWGDYLPPENTTKSFENTFGALEAYLAHHPPQTDCIQPLKRPDGSPTVEFTFSIPIEDAPPHPETGDPFLFVGRFDLLGAYNDLPCVVDEKTTTAIGFTWDSQWDLRGQFMGYIWACQQLGYPVNTAVVRGIGILKRDYKFATSIKQFPQYLIERWYQQLIWDITHITTAYRDARDGVVSGDYAFPFNFADACSSYGGCAFVPLCCAKDPQAFFGNYVKHRWNPLAKQPVEELENA